ncbi:hypothetical protein ACH427_04440 [Streptomyces sp. NPDC020379]|uniref:hypothetical protein n=1 Tax=Streptomyces sp. NPDC020379 TaxID=3365071 RepID=UPI0037B9F662
MHDAQQRLRSLWRYVSEVEPEWQDEEKVAYMDNSVELVQVDKYGNRRRKTLEYPSGDACF